MDKEDEDLRSRSEAISHYTRLGVLIAIFIGFGIYSLAQMA